MNQSAAPQAKAASAAPCWADVITISGWMVVFVRLFVTAQAHFSPTQRHKRWAFLCLFLVLLDPGNLYAWWMD